MPTCSRPRSRNCSDSSELDRIVLTHAHVDHIGGVKQVTEKIRRDGSAQDAVGGSRCARRRDFTQSATTRWFTLKAPRCARFLLPVTRPITLLLSRRRASAVHGGRRAGRRHNGDSGRHRRLGRVHGFAQAPARARSRNDLSGARPGHPQSERKDREYIAHRELRERQVLEALADGAGPLEAMAIVKKIYVDVPEYLHRCGGKLGSLASEKARARRPRGGA